MADPVSQFTLLEQIRVDSVRDLLEASRDHYLSKLGGDEFGGADRHTDGLLRDTVRDDIAAIDSWIGGSNALLLGRVVAKDGKEYFIGRRAGLNDPFSDEIVVINSLTTNRFVEGFFQATVANPKGMGLIVKYFWRDGDPWQLSRCGIANLAGLDLGLDVPIVQLAPEAELVELVGTTTRDGALRDVLSSFQADQDRLVREPLPGILIVQGGPGTGKTIVGVERAAWAELESQSGRILFVAPTRTFFEYTRPLVASLGARRIDQRLLRNCGLGEVRVGKVESPRVARVKGSVGMLKLLERAVEHRVRVRGVSLPISDTGQTVEVSEVEIGELVEAVRQSSSKYNAAAQDFRRRLVEIGGGKAEEAGICSSTDFAKNLDRPALGRAVGSVWPRLRPEEMLGRLYRDASALEAARGDDMSADNARLLHVSDASEEPAWSEHDLPVLDELRVMLDDEIAVAFDHVVVDEAQDLTPMQVRMLARRARRNSMTLLGDIAQATGPSGSRSWHELLGALPGNAASEARIEALTRGFRVPAQFMKLAQEALDHIDPERELPRVEAIVEGQYEPTLTAVPLELLGHEVAVHAQDAVGEFGRVVVIGTETRLAQLEVEFADLGVEFVSRLADGTDGIILRTPEEVKGLEYDAAIVIEPRDIALSSEQGAQLLYVALTRAATKLTVLHAKGLPPELGGEPLKLATPETFQFGGSIVQVDADAGPFGDRLVTAFAFARTVYGNRARRKSYEPHLPHALEVAALVMADGADEDEVIAALLHDAFEHQNWSDYAREVEKHFGRHVAEIITACSWRAQGVSEPWNDWKSEYLQALATYDGPHRDVVYRITLAEKLSNARDFLDDADVTAGALWVKTSDEPDDVVRYYRKLADIFRGTSSEPLSREFDRVLDDLDTAVTRLAAAGATTGEYPHESGDESSVEWSE